MLVGLLLWGLTLAFATMMGDYLRLARLRDRSLESFMQKLGQTEYGKKTIVVFCGDHQCRMDESQLSLLGLPRSRVLHHRAIRVSLTAAE